MPVLVIYHGEILDDNGLPELTNDEAIAIADYCAYWTLFKRSISTNNPNIINLNILILFLVCRKSYCNTCFM